MAIILAIAKNSIDYHGHEVVANVTGPLVSVFLLIVGILNCLSLNTILKMRQLRVDPNSTGDLDFVAQPSSSHSFNCRFSRVTLSLKFPKSFHV